jgi:uncharacterized membrane protein
MNQAHLHLLLNHLPTAGSILGALVLIQGLWTKSNNTLIAAYNVLILSALGGIVTYLTGEAAEETVEHIQGISKAAIEEHELAAKFALAAVIIIGIGSIIGIYLTAKKSPRLRTCAWVIMFISIWSFSVIARTAYLGGEIRHTEFNSSTPTQQPMEEGEHN